MDGFYVLLFLAACVAGGEAVPVKKIVTVKRVFCIDFNGVKIAPGHIFSDGCNMCTCGPKGMPTMCTKKLCPKIPTYPLRPLKKPEPHNPLSTFPKGPFKHFDQKKPVVPVIKPVMPYVPVKPVKPINPVYPVHTAKKPVVVGKKLEPFPVYP